MYKKPTSLVLDFSFDEANLRFEDNPMKQSFVNQNEISEHLADRGKFMVKPNVLLNLLKKFKKLGVYSKYMEWKVKKFRARYEKPDKYLDFNNAFRRVQSIDEAQGYVQADMFQNIIGAVHHYSADYLGIHARSFFKPVVEFQKVAFDSDMFSGILNPEGNPDLFTVDSVNRIFNRFELPVVFNKLTNKFFYDGSLKIGTAKLCLQGKSTFLFFNDFFENFYRLIDAVDISRGVDPKQEKLPYYQGIDKNRHR